VGQAPKLEALRCGCNISRRSVWNRAIRAALVRYASQQLWAKPVEACGMLHRPGRERLVFYRQFGECADGVGLRVTS